MSFVHTWAAVHLLPAFATNHHFYPCLAPRRLGDGFLNNRAGCHGASCWAGRDVTVVLWWRLFFLFRWLKRDFLFLFDWWGRNFLFLFDWRGRNFFFLFYGWGWNFLFLLNLFLFFFTVGVGYWRGRGQSIGILLKYQKNSNLSICVLECF